MSIRILVTARDPGSAHQNKVFVQTCLGRDYELDFCAVVEGVAIQIFGNLSIKTSAVDLCTASQITISKKRLDRIFSEYSPDFALLGLSGIGYGIDELAREYCKSRGVPCGVIQDYWGYTGRFSLDTLPDYFFVLDEHAERLTRLKTNSKAHCIISGSPKHEAYQRHISHWISEKPLVCNREKSVVFIGQPSEISGILQNFKIFIRTINQLDCSCKLFFKPHPADYAHKHYYEVLLKSQNYDYEIISDSTSVEAVLCQADLVVTCFSTSGLDHNYLQLYAGTNLGQLVYLTIGRDIQLFIEQVVGEAGIPGAKGGMGTVCTTEQQLIDALQNCFSGLKSGYSESVKKCLGREGSPTQTIFKFLQSEIV